MSCNSCAKPYTLLRKEKGCPSCGFSYCGSCLNNKIFVKKLQADAKVCLKCKKSEDSPSTTSIVYPEAYYKRLGATTSLDKTTHKNLGPKEIEIQERLEKLKMSKEKVPTEEEIAERLNKIKGPVPSTSTAEIEERLARLRGAPTFNDVKPAVSLVPDLRSEQEQADDLMKQYVDQTNIDKQYRDQFDSTISNMEDRLTKLKGKNQDVKDENKVEVENEEEMIRNIVEKYKAQAILEQDDTDAQFKIEELPFCEICNEDATVRCLGCRYIFCKRCFMEHRDDDDGCNRYEAYSAPKKH